MILTCISCLVNLRTHWRLIFKIPLFAVGSSNFSVVFLSSRSLISTEVKTSTSVLSLSCFLSFACRLGLDWIGRESGSLLGVLVDLGINFRGGFLETIIVSSRSTSLIARTSKYTFHTQFILLQLIKLPGSK